MQDTTLIALIEVVDLPSEAIGFLATPFLRGQKWLRDLLAPLADELREAEYEPKYEIA
jgi:hypothetical protein